MDPDVAPLVDEPLEEVVVPSALPLSSPAAVDSPPDELPSEMKLEPDDDEPAISTKAISVIADGDKLSPELSLEPDSVVEKTVSANVL